MCEAVGVALMGVSLLVYVTLRLGVEKPDLLLAFRPYGNLVAAVNPGSWESFSLKEKV